MIEAQVELTLLKKALVHWYYDYSERMSSSRRAQGTKSSAPVKPTFVSASIGAMTSAEGFNG